MQSPETSKILQNLNLDAEAEPTETEIVHGKIINEFLEIEGRNIPKQEKRYLKSRVIINNPAAFVVCLGCESITEDIGELIFCPTCNGYNLSNNKEKIIECAEISGRNEEIIPEINWED